MSLRSNIYQSLLRWGSHFPVYFKIQGIVEIKINKNKSISPVTNGVGAIFSETSLPANFVGTETGAQKGVPTSKLVGRDRAKT